jgi:hypothetical protein
MVVLVFIIGNFAMTSFSEALKLLFNVFHIYSEYFILKCFLTKIYCHFDLLIISQKENILY